MNGEYPKSAEDDEYLRWEYTLVARAELIWATNAFALARAADLIWTQHLKMREVWANAFSNEPHLVDQRPPKPLTSEELELFQNQGLDKVALFLLGSALEVTVKGFLIDTTPGLIQESGTIALKTHDLLELIRQVDVSLSADEAAQLVVLRDYVEWIGRYPVPQSAVGKGASRSRKGAWVSDRLPHPTTTWLVNRNLLERLFNKRDGRHQRGWDDLNSPDTSNTRTD